MKFKDEVVSAIQTYNLALYYIILKLSKFQFKIH